jgi:hypothetical protein
MDKTKGNNMTVEEYIRKKNEILYDITGITLVPEDQIIDIDPMKLSIESDSKACPYCIEYLFKYESCKSCPMFLAGNECVVNDNNTYEETRNGLEGSIIKIKKIRDLIKEYNESNEFI